MPFFVTFLLKINSMCIVIHICLSFKRNTAQEHIVPEKEEKQKLCRLIYSSISDAEAKGMQFSWLGHKIDLPLKMFHVIALYMQTPKRSSFEKSVFIDKCFWQSNNKWGRKWFQGVCLLLSSQDTQRHS